MKTLIALLAAGTAYYFTSRVYITGPLDWGAIQPSTSQSNTYDVSTSITPLVAVGVSGDAEFSIDASACPGARSCTATVSFLADLGGDYVGAITGTSASAAPRTRGSSTTKNLTAHVVGANYVLTGADNGNSTATFTLTSTGESDLLLPGFAVSTVNNVGTATIAADSCGDAIPNGASCTVDVAFSYPPEGFLSYGYVLLQASANTRQQPPVRVTLVLPPRPDSVLGPTPIIVD